MLGLKPIKMLPARERVAAALRKAIISRSFVFLILTFPRRFVNEILKRTLKSP